MAVQTSTPIPLLIIGAGPFGLALAAYAKGHNIEHAIVGKPMDFWQSNMPANMYLRSDCSWHFDPFNEATIERYLQTLNLVPADVEPLALDFYLGYCHWFQQQKDINALPAWVEQLDYLPDLPPLPGNSERRPYPNSHQCRPRPRLPLLQKYPRPLPNTYSPW